MTTNWNPPPGQPMQPGPGGYGPPPAPRKRSWARRHKVLTGILAAIVIIFIAVVASAAGSSGSNTGSNTTASSGQSAASVTNTTPAQGVLCKTPGATAKNGGLTCSSNGVWEITGSTSSNSNSSQAPPAAPVYTASQQQAVDAAEGYLSDGEGFSRAGLIQQLDSPDGNGFSRHLATFAVDHVQVSWRHQAALAAEGYVSDGEGFSYSGLVQQLESPYGNQFTYSQAVYGAKAAGL